MNEKDCDVLIIGAGLSGLTTAYFLKNNGLDVDILESRNRIGGRINTIYKDDRAPLEMGATWLGNKHIHLSALLEELGLEVFPQLIGTSAIYEAISTSPHYLAKLPPNPEPSLRIKGGTSSLTSRLLEDIGPERVHLSTEVKSIEEGGKKLTVISSKGVFRAKKVISSLPPKLFVNTINFTPSLPRDLLSIANTTHTWMGESIKIALTFKEAFWRREGLSGTIMSNVGPIPEMYDHSDYEDNLYALKGFLSSSFYNLTKEERLELILKQLRKYYGRKIDTFVSYEEALWIKEGDTFFPYSEHVLPHQNNGHPIYKKTYMNEKLFIGGSETASSFPGYMDGAVERAKEIANEILK